MHGSSGQGVLGKMGELMNGLEIVLGNESHSGHTSTTSVGGTGERKEHVCEKIWAAVSPQRAKF